MPKSIVIDPREVRGRGAVTFADIPLNSYTRDGKRELARYGREALLGAWRDMGVVNLPSGRPTLELTGGAARALARLTPESHEVRIDLSITDDFPTAQAIVIITAVKLSLRD